MIQLHPDTADKAGISPKRVEFIKEMCSGWVTEGATPALIVLAARRGVLFLHEAWGQLEPGPNSPPVERDSIFGVASVSKPVTATAMMILVEGGRLRLDQPVQKYLPEFKGEGFEKVTIRHLLTHTSGLPYISDAAFSKIGETGIKLEPGREVVYSNVGYDLLGEVVQKVSGQSFQDFTQQHIFKPLGMKDATFIHPGDLGERCIKRRPGTNYDWSENVAGNINASSTLWATALDMGIFAQMFLNGGRYGDFCLLHPDTVAAMTHNQVVGIPPEIKNGIAAPPNGYGWFMLEDLKFPNYISSWSSQSYGHAGASGAFVWVDPAYELVGVFFFTRIRDDVHPVGLFADAIMGALVEK